jgi:hypothetical protein
MEGPLLFQAFGEGQSTMAFERIALYQRVGSRKRQSMKLDIHLVFSTAVMARASCILRLMLRKLISRAASSVNNACFSFFLLIQLLLSTPLCNYCSAH